MDLVEEDIKSVFSDLKFRHIRYVDREGNFKKMRKKFRCYEKLLRELEKRKYSDAYYSVARFLNPENIASKLSERPYETVFLGMDLFFDVDFKEESIEKNIEKGVLEVKKIIDFSRDKDWKIRYIAFSGYKGFHISFEDISNYSNLGNPKEREEKAIEDRKEIIEEMVRKGITIDEKITVDSRRIVRLPYTYNSKTGYMCLPIKKSALGLPAKEILRRIPYSIDRRREKSPVNRAMTLLKKCLKTVLGRVSRSLLGSRDVCFYYCVKSNCKKNHCLILRILRYSEDKKELLKSLNIPYVVIKLDTSLYVFSPAVFQKSEIAKISLKLKSPDFAAINKYRHTVIPIDFFDQHLRRARVKKEVKDIYLPSEPSRVLCATHSMIFQLLTGTQIGGEVNHDLCFCFLKMED